MKHKHKIIIGACGVIVFSAFLLASNVDYMRTQNGVISITNNGINMKPHQPASKVVQDKDGHLTFSAQ